MSQRYSFIIPVYNRPDEVSELLGSIAQQELSPYEIIIVEDGSVRPCEDIVANWKDILPIRYFFKANSGPGPSRNYGAAKAEGNYLIFLDSDCILPPGYLKAIDLFLSAQKPALFGGPDAAHPDFTLTQKAINHAMTGFWTTGGIRGGSEQMDRFFPRSFNMGVRTAAFQAVNGFSPMRFGEDIDFSIRIMKGGYTSALISSAWVYHKRRSTFRQFFKQVYNSGMARIHLTKLHPGTLKPVHILPSAFVIGSSICAVGGLFFHPFVFIPILLFALLVFSDALMKKNNIAVALWSIPAAFLQLWGYGLGFLHAFVNLHLLKRGPKNAFEKNFYE